MKMLIIALFLLASPALAQTGFNQNGCSGAPSGYVHTIGGCASATTPSMPNAVLFAANYASGDTASGGIRACINALPSTGGTCDARGVGTSGALTVTENISLGSDTKQVTLLLGQIGITLSGAQILVFNGSTIIGQGMDDPSRAPGTYILGTSTGPLLTYGDALDTTPNYYVNLSNFRIRNTGTGQAIYLPSLSSSTLSHVVAVGGSAGISIGGTASCACYNSFYQVFTSGTTNGFVLGSSANQNQFFSGQLGGPTGLYINGGYSNQFFSPDFENNTTAAADINGSSNVFFAPYFEGSQPVILESGAQGNTFLGGGGAGAGPSAVTDNSGNDTNLVLLSVAANGNMGALPKWLGSSAGYIFGPQFGSNTINNDAVLELLNTDELHFNFPSGSSNCVNYSRCGDTVPIYAGVIHQQATPTTLAGTTAGNLYWSQPFQGTAYKKVVLNFQGFENTSATAQTVTFPTAFSYTPAVDGCTLPAGVTVSTTQMAAASMGGTFTGQCIVEGQ